jgi:cytochrome c biogenesis protein CcdA
MDTPSLSSTQKWLRIYHIFSFFVGLCFTAFFCLFLILPSQTTIPFDSDIEEITFYLTMGFTTVYMVFSTVITLIAAIIVRKRSKFNWILQLVMVIPGLTSILLILPALYLMLGLLSKESKDYYFKRS